MDSGFFGQFGHGFQWYVWTEKTFVFLLSPFFLFFFLFLPFLIWYHMTWWSGLFRPLSGLCQPKLFCPKFQHWGHLRGWAKLVAVSPVESSLLLKACSDGASASSGSNNLRRQRVPASSGGNEFQHPQATTSSSCPWLLVSVLLFF